MVSSLAILHCQKVLEADRFVSVQSFIPHKVFGMWDELFLELAELQEHRGAVVVPANDQTFRDLVNVSEFLGYIRKHQKQSGGKTIWR